MILSAANITKRYNRYTILNGIDLTLNKGDRIALSGRSGVGKSTLIHILAGLDTDFTGRVESSVSSKGVVFQDCGLFSHKTMRENILYLLDTSKFDKPSYERWLEVCDLKDVEDNYPYQLSRGMKQKAAIIRGFIREPELIFLDEPFSGIDGESIEKIVSYIVEKYQMVTMLIASHSSLPQQLCSDTFILYHNRIEKA